MDKKIGDAKKAADYARNNANTKSVGNVRNMWQML